MVQGTIIIPTAKDDAQGTVTEIQRLFAQRHGGYSTYTGHGGWMNDNGELIEESHVRLQISDGNRESVSESLQIAADTVKTELDETEVFAEIVESDVLLL